MSERHKVFLSYYHKDDNIWRERFEEIFKNIFINKSVQPGDIDTEDSALYIKRLIQEDYLSDTSVLVVLIGPRTWGRKHVDWEISAALDARVGDHVAGIMGLILPTHDNYYDIKYDPNLVPPRLVDNQESGYAKIYNWTEDVQLMQQYVQTAFEDRTRKEKYHTNKRLQMKRNRSGSF